MIRSGLIVLVLIASLLAASTWRIYGHTWDEPEHLAAGLELLDRGKYEYDTEHPPIARLFIALVILTVGVAGALKVGADARPGFNERRPRS